MNVATQVLDVVSQQAPEDVGKAGPFGLLLLALLLIAAALLVKSMSGHLKKLPRSFDEQDRQQIVVPDDISELDRPGDEPGQELLDSLRRAPLAIEPPRREDGEGTAPQR